MAQPIDKDYLTDYFNTYYEEHAVKYYEKRIAYNDANIGTLGYLVYQKTTTGELKYLGRTETPSFTITNPSSGTNTYVIKSAYSKFTSNMSDGLSVKISTNIDSNVDDMITDNDKPSTNSGVAGNNKPSSGPSNQLS